MALTAAEVRAEEVAHWAFSTGAGILAADSSGHGLDGTLLDDPMWSDGRFGGGLDFAPQQARVAVPAHPAIDQLSQVTLSAWVRQPHVGSYSALLDKRDHETDGYNLYLNHQGYAFFRVNRKTLVGSTLLSDGAWHHVAGVWDGTQMELYVDGLLVRSRAASISSVGSLDVQAPLVIGGHFQGLPELQQPGSLDEVRVYDHALEAAEILALLSPASQDQEAPNIFSAAPTGALLEGTTSTTISVSTDEPAACRWSPAPETPFDEMTNLFLPNGGQAHTTSFGPLENGGTYTFFVRCVDHWGNRQLSDFVFAFSVQRSRPPGLLAHWSFEEQGGTTTTDLSGLGHHADLVASAGFTQGFVGGGLSLEGSGNAATVPAAEQLGQLTALTLSTFLRSETPGRYASIVDFRQTGSLGYDLYLDPMGYPFLRINDETLLGNTTITDQVWHHLAAVWDGASMALYVDGVLDASREVSPDVLEVSGSLWIGRHFQNDPRFEWNGLLDELQIYDRPLSAAEVAAFVQQERGDPAAPQISDLEPSAVLPAGTTSVALTLNTDEFADCRWSPLSGIAWGEMPNLFETTNGFDHSFLITDLVDGSSSTQFVRCADSLGNANNSDTPLVVSVANTTGSPSSPIAFWNFDEGSGLLVADVSGHGHDGTLSEDTTWIEGYLGSGLNFSATAAKVQIDHDGDLGQLQALTITAWVHSVPPVAFASIVDCRDQIDSGYDFYLDEQGRPFARINQATLAGSTSVSDQSWHHLAMVWDGALLSIYVDGSDEARQFIQQSPIQTTAPVLLGSHFLLGGAFGFGGSLDEVRIYDRALAVDEILLLSSTSLTLAPGFADRHIVQRQATSADVPLGGSFRSSLDAPPSAIEGRVVEAETGLPLAGLDWQVVDAAPAAGQWSGTLPAVPQGGWYRVELRFENDPFVTLTPPNRFGVGMVIAALGQSSMAKLFTEISFPEDDDLGLVSEEPADDLAQRQGYGEPRISSNNPGGYLRTVSNLPQPQRGEVTGAGAIRLVNRLVQELQIPVMVLDYAIDGTSILRWTDPTWIGRLHFEDGLRTVGGEVELVLWFQGGTDILNGMPGSLYQSHLEAFFAQLQDLLPVGRPLEFFVATQGRGDYPGLHDEAYTAIRGVQLRWPENRPHIHHAGSAIDLQLAASTYQRGDGHLPASQIQILADRFSRAIFDWLGQPGHEGGVRGGEIQTARQLGNEVHVEILHHQGSEIHVREPDADVEGFELSGDGFQTVWRLGAGIASAVISEDAQRVVLTLSNQVTGPLQLRYLYGMNPWGLDATEEERRTHGNLLYDDFQYYIERDGLPINPTVDPLDVTPGL